MQNASLRIGFLLLAASLTLLGCENSASHRGGSKARKAKAQPTPEPVKQDAPVQAAEEEPVVVQQQPEPVVQPETSPTAACYSATTAATGSATTTGDYATTSGGAAGIATSTSTRRRESLCPRNRTI